MKRAVAYEKLENFQSALNDYKKAIEVVHGYPIFAEEAYQKMAKLYRSLGINKEAINAYGDLVKLYQRLDAKGDNLPYCYTQLGNIHIDLGNYPEALRNYGKAIDLKPQNGVLYILRGGAYLDLKNYEQAINDFDKAIELIPTGDIAYHYRGIAFVNMGNFKQGIDDIKIAARLGHKEAQEKLKEWKVDW